MNPSAGRGIVGNLFGSHGVPWVLVHKPVHPVHRSQPRPLQVPRALGCVCVAVCRFFFPPVSHAVTWVDLVS